MSKCAIPACFAAFLLSVGAIPVLCKDAVLPEPSKGLKLIEQRYADFVRYREVNWEDPDVVDTVKQIEFEAGKLLQQQVTAPSSPWQGCFHVLQKGPGPPAGEALLSARREAEEGIHVLSSAYWCRGNRFYRSARVIGGIEKAYNFLIRKQDTSQIASVNDMAPAYRHAPDNLCRWLAQVGEFLGKAERADMKDQLRRIIVREKASDISDVMYELIGAACLEDDRLLASARQNMNRLAVRTVAEDGSMLSPQGELCIEDAARYVSTVGQYQYLTRDTDYCLPEAFTLRAERLLNDFIAWTVYDGRSDLLAYRFPLQWTARTDQEIALGAAHLAAIDPGTADKWPASFMGVVERAFDRKRRGRSFLDFYPLLAGLQGGPTAFVEPRSRYFDEGGYLAMFRPSFFASLRMPLKAGYTAQYSRLTGAMNIRCMPNDPNLLLGMPQFEPLLLGCTFSPYIARKKDYYLVDDVSQITCADAAILDESNAMAGMRMVIKRKDNVLCANKSWTFLEDKIIMAASGIEAKSLEISNKAWEANPTDHRAAITFVFPKPVEIDFARVYFRVYQGKLFCVPPLIHFMVSDDGARWTAVRTAKEGDLPRSDQPPLGGSTYRLRKHKTRLFRLFFPEDADGFTTQIAEVELFNIDAKHDDDPVPPGAENLARTAKVFASSTFTDKSGPERINDGDWAAVLEPPMTRTCIAVLRTRATQFVFMGARGLLKTAYPEPGHEQRLQDVVWCHTKQMAFFFLQPADVIVSSIGQGYATICVDHSEKNSFAVVCFPDLDLEQASRAADAGLVKPIRLDPSAHVFADVATGITSAAFFGTEKGEGISSDGPAYILYRQGPGLILAGKSFRAAPSDVWINAPETTALVVNGQPQNVYKNGPMVRISAHR